MTRPHVLAQRNAKEKAGLKTEAEIQNRLERLDFAANRAIAFPRLEFLHEIGYAGGVHEDLGKGRGSGEGEYQKTHLVVAYNAAREDLRRAG